MSLQGRLEAQTLDTALVRQKSLAINPEGIFRVYCFCPTLEERMLIHEITLVNWQRYCCYEKAVELAPNSAAAHSNLGAALLMQGKLNRAEVVLQQTLELKPDFAIAHYNLAMVLDYQGKVEAALESYQQAQALAPQVEEIFYSLNYLRLKLCDWDNYNARIQEFVNRLETLLKTKLGIPLAPFILSAFPVPQALHTDVARRMAQTINQSMAQIKASCNFALSTTTATLVVTLQQLLALTTPLMA
ncbi:tetratricopeptide repeat protein [Nostoc sp. UHCC 0702]|nr:tetratricopeptide repeat protein [Nostoc sp. UHCC 0702]